MRKEGRYESEFYERKAGNATCHFDGIANDTVDACKCFV